jgi:hypothetical protein
MLKGVRPGLIFPLITDFKGVTRTQINSVAEALSALLRQGGMSQMALAVGLCNALSLCLEMTIRKVKTEEHRAATREIENHLEHIVNILNLFHRHPEDEIFHRIRSVP